jgi:hypothetical protein
MKAVHQSHSLAIHNHTTAPTKPTHNTQVAAAATGALVAVAAASAAATNQTQPSGSSSPSSPSDPTTTPPLPSTFTFLPSYSGDPAAFQQWRPMSCSADAHSYCFPRCAPRGGARPRCAGGASWRLDAQTGLCFRLTGAAADSAVAAARKQKGEMEVKLRAWSDDPLEPGEVTRTPPRCAPGSSAWPPTKAPAGVLGASGAVAAAASVPDPKLCLMCQPGDTLDLSVNPPRCMKPCPSGYDAVIVGGGGGGAEDGEETAEGDGATSSGNGAPFCVQRCRPQDGYPYGRYCVAYDGFDYPSDCGWMASCEDGSVLLQHGKGAQQDNGAEADADGWGDLFSGGDGEKVSSGAAAENNANDPLGLKSPPFSHMWASEGVNDEAVGLGDGYGGPNPDFPFGAAARRADAALLRRRQQQRRLAPGGAGARHAAPGTPLSALSSDPLAPFLDQFDRRYVQSPRYDAAAPCRCARVASGRDVRPRAQYLPLARLPEPEVQTALPRCVEVREGEMAVGKAAAEAAAGIGECAYDRQRGACACACPAGWRAAGGGDSAAEASDMGVGGVCCDPSCPEGFKPCEAGGRRFCATSSQLLGADSCDVLSRLLPFLSPSAACGASAPEEGDGGVSSPALAGFSARAVGNTVSSNEGGEEAKSGYPGALFAGITSLPDVFSDGGRQKAATAASGGRAGGEAIEADDLSASLLAHALERQYQVTTNAPPPPMTVQEVLSMDPWAEEFGGGGGGGAASK